MKCGSLAEAYAANLADLLDTPEFLNSPRGFPSQEKLGAAFSIADPLRRVLPARSRRANLVFNFAEALWYFAGRGDLEYLAYYAPSVRRFVMGADQLTGTAYGPRIFDFGAGALDQWSSVVETLTEDPDSKRAVIQIFQPEELTVRGNPDVACTLGLQFLARDGSLHLVAYMRANDAFRGLASDVFSFTFLQELMARQLGLKLGGYTHMVGSLHLYAPDLDAARRVHGAPHTPGQPLDRMPAMPAGDQRVHVDRVMRTEERLRTDRIRLDVPSLRALGLPDYWTQVLAVFELYRRTRHDDTGQNPGELLEEIPPLYRYMLLNRFPTLGTTAMTQEAR
ncbi:thymidylate synthase [Actinocorallia lasiicapitis]